MAHFAKVYQGRVTNVIVAEADFFDHFQDTEPGIWIQTSYNTRGNVHYGPDGLPDGRAPLRGNYAGIDYIYDKEYDVFYEPQPFSSYVLNHTTWLWEPPIAYPTDGRVYDWDEPTQGWILNEELTILKEQQ